LNTNDAKSDPPRGWSRLQMKRRVESCFCTIACTADDIQACTKEVERTKKPWSQTLRRQGKISETMEVAFRKLRRSIGMRGQPRSLSRFLASSNNSLFCCMDRMNLSILAYTKIRTRHFTSSIVEMCAARLVHPVSLSNFVNYYFYKSPILNPILSNSM
jgi:hypothetical protein